MQGNRDKRVDSGKFTGPIESEVQGSSEMCGNNCTLLVLELSREFTGGSEIRAQSMSA